MQFEYLGKQIDGVTFDLEGTIIDLEAQHHQAHAEVAREIGVELDVNDPETFIKVPHMIGGPDRRVMEDIVRLAQEQEVPGNIPPLEDMLQRDKEIYHTLIQTLGNEHFAPRPGFLNLFHQLETYGVPIAIGTLTEANDAFLLLAKSGLAEKFRSFNFFTHEDVLHTKPDPEVYRATAGMMRISPYRQLVFEDSHNGIISAREAGSIPIAVPIYTDPKLLDRLADAGAQAIYGDWRDITINPVIRLEGVRSGNLLEGRRRVQEGIMHVRSEGNPAGLRPMDRR